MLGFADHYALVVRYILEEQVRPGRDAAWRASLILGCVYALPVVIGLTVVRYGFGAQVSGFETMLVAWLIIGSIAVPTHIKFGRTVAAEVGEATQRDRLGRSLCVVGLSAIAVAGFVSAVALCFEPGSVA